jgi:hypothetical protein
MSKFDEEKINCTYYNQVESSKHFHSSFAPVLSPIIIYQRYLPNVP